MNVNFKMFVNVQHYSNLSDTVNYSTKTSYISPQLPHLHNKGFKNSTAGEMKIISHLTWYYTIHLWSLCPLNLLVYSLLWSKCQCDHSMKPPLLNTFQYLAILATKIEWPAYSLWFLSVKWTKKLSS